MAAKTKPVYIGTRVTMDDFEVINQYTDATTMDRAELLRKGTMEYILNHPAPSVPKSKMLRSAE